MSSKQNNLWWGPPKNFDERKHERKISWLELFYDLVYVAAISQLTHHIAAHPSWQTLLFSFLLFSMIFWSWVNGGQYYALHGNDSIRTRLLTFWQMLAVAAVAVTVADAFEGDHKAFSSSFAVVQIIITYLWWSVGFYDPSHRVFSKFFTYNYIIAFLLLVASAFTSYNIAIILWIIVLLLDVSPSLIGAGTIIRELKKRNQVFTASATLVERFGLFTIIVLAESILGIVSGIAEIKNKYPAAWIAFIIGILIAFLLWSIYFDMTSEQETKQGYHYLQWLIFLHFPLLAAFGSVGACIKVLLTDMRADLHKEVQWIFCVSLAMILLTIIGITKIMKEGEEDRTYIRTVSRLLIIAGLIILLIPLFGYYFDTLTFLAIIAFILLIPVLIGVRSWVRYKFFSGSTDDQNEL